MYELTHKPELGVMLLGMMEVLATDHPDWTYWQILAQVRKQVEVIWVQ